MPETETEWAEYYDLRYRVLREPLGQVRGSERNEGDITADHFAYYIEGKLVAVGRLDYVDQECCQVRFVAVEPYEQGKGHGLQLMREIEKFALKKKYIKIILHARDYALQFYAKQGYELIGPSHKLFGVLQHYRMEKRLN